MFITKNDDFAQLVMNTSLLYKSKTIIDYLLNELKIAIFYPNCEVRIDRIVGCGKYYSGHEIFETFEENEQERKVNCIKLIVDHVKKQPHNWKEFCDNITKNMKPLSVDLLYVIFEFIFEAHKTQIFLDLKEIFGYKIDLGQKRFGAIKTESNSFENKEIESKFIEEFWRRNFSDYFKTPTQIEEVLEKLIFENDISDDEKNNDDFDDDNSEYLLDKYEEKQYEKYAKIKLGIIKNETFDIENDSDDMTVECKEYKPYKLINYEDNKEKLDKIINMILNKIGYYDDKPYLGKIIDGKLRWLMVIQALRFSSNSAINNDEYICAYDCLCNDTNKILIKECLKTYIEYKENLCVAKNIIMTENIFSFCGKILKLCPTRGGKIFRNVCSLLFDNKINGHLIPLYDKKLKIIMNGKYASKHKIISLGLPWIRCPLNKVIKFKSVIGDKKWKIIEKSMHGRYVWHEHRYRESDIPNRHGHCNSNPNPSYVQYFSGFGV